jgi:uncharacterized protein YdhG (YjbR/CyaY superfamily)
MAPPRTIDAYLADQPDEMRAALERMRAVIRAELPEATETISYGMPTFKYHGRGVVAIAAWKSHCALYPMSYAVMDAHKDELAKYDVSKGTVRFSPSTSFDDELLRKIVADRVAENEARLHKT